MAPGGGITVSVNGEARQLPAGSTISDLLRELSLDRARIAVAQSAWSAREHASGASTTAMRWRSSFVGGG